MDFFLVSYRWIFNRFARSDIARSGCLPRFPMGDLCAVSFSELPLSPVRKIGRKPIKPNYSAGVAGLAQICAAFNTTGVGTVVGGIGVMVGASVGMTGA